jgi:hypothetical protein
MDATDDGMPRRSVRVVAQGKNRVANLEQQARNVLLHQLNIISEKQSLDTEAIKTYDSISILRWGRFSAGPFELSSLRTARPRR